MANRHSRVRLRGVAILPVLQPPYNQHAHEMLVRIPQRSQLARAHGVNLFHCEPEIA